jgi:hypothetical protein
MSSSSNPLFRLRADAQFPSAAVSIFDGHYGVLAEGFGSVEADVAAGLYLVQFKAGQLFEKQAVDVSANTTIVAKVFSLPTAQAQELPAHTPSEDGKCRLYISTDGESGEAFLTHLSILDAKRNNIFVSPTAEQVPPAQRDLNVFPGQYLLRAEVEPGRSLEQALFLPAGWQTQIFFRTEGSKMMESDLCRWMTTAVVMLLPEDFAFVASVRDRDEFEAAMQNLASNQPIALTSRALDEQGAASPMFDLIAAYSLLRDRDANPAFNQAMQSLRLTIPQHPDVIALELLLNPVKATNATFDLPPMLRTSWRILVEQSLNCTSIFPASSRSALAACNLTGVRGWLVWRTPGPNDRLLEPTEDLRDLIKEVRSKVSAFATGKTEPELQAVVRMLDLKGVEGPLLVYMVSVVRGEDSALALVNALYGSRLVDSIYSFFRRFLPGVQLVPKQTILQTATSLIQMRTTELALVRSLEIPKATLQSALASLDLKLKGAAIVSAAAH